MGQKEEGRRVSRREGGRRKKLEKGGGGDRRGDGKEEGEQTVSSLLCWSAPSQSTAIKSTTVKKGGVARSKTTPTTVDGVVSEILRTFVDAVPHIPDHRRLMLFSHLIETVGPSDYLHVGLGLLVEKQVLQATGDKVSTWGRNCGA